MKLFANTHAFSHSWQQVTAANWRKYPNEMSPQVVNVDILNRSVDPTTGIMKTERLIACKQPIPSWMRRLFGADDVSYCYEVSYTDARRQSHESTTTNLTFSDMMRLEERVKYTADPQKPTEQTVMEQSVAVDADAFYSAIKNRVEEFSVSRFQVNAEKGRAALEMVINKQQQQSQQHLFSSPPASRTTPTTSVGK